MSLLDQLNPEQRAAAEAIEGPVLIIAGAGSGKTRTLTYRIAHMVCERGIVPHTILAVTFTNKAANEMKERIQALVGKDARGLWAGTFHSVCARILRAHGAAIGIADNYVIYDEGDQRALLKQALSLLDIDSQIYKPADMGYAISAAKNELIGVQQFRRGRRGHQDDTVQRVYAVYQRKLRENNALDFDDLLMRTVELFRDHPEVLAEYQERFHHILVDEYQDINHAQHQLIKLLAQKRRNVCVVGDDDQSIYGWRGANIGLILAYEDDYPEARIFKLEQNYRSTQKILECAHAVISQNAGRRDKKLWTDNQPGQNLVVYPALSAEEEAEWVADTIQTQVAGGRSRFGDYAILYRANAMSRVFEEQLMHLKVPYELVGGIRFYERAVIKDFIAYLKAVFNPADGVSLRRIINVPARGIGDKTVGVIDREAETRGCSMYEALPQVLESEELGTRARHAIAGFYDLMEKLHRKAATLSLTEFCRAVAEDSGYLTALKGSGAADDATKAENLEEFVSMAQRFAEREPGADLARFLEHVALISDLDQAAELGSRVALMTMHSAKGLEFPVVFMVGLEEGIFPHQRSMADAQQLEEERRLCYVAMTRARHMLFLSHAARRVIYGTPQMMVKSRFLKDLPPQLVDWYLEGTRNTSPRLPGADGEAELVVAGRRIDLTKIMSRVSQNGATARARNEAAVTPEVPAAPPAPAPTRPAGGQRRTTRGKAPAPIEGIPFRSGDKVKHAKYGSGIVVQVTGEGADVQLTVAFPQKGVKQLLAAYAHLERL